MPTLLAPLVAALPMLLTPATQPAASAPAAAPAAVTAPEVDPIAALVGKAPPPIVVAKWVKGGPVTLEKGTVYVVDFWATWCGPCRAAIPHLTQLAHDLKGKVTVIGVSISEKQTSPEDTSYIERVQAAVDKMGERMDYPVAVDTPGKTMHATWFKPTGTGGIPTAYIIDAAGNVAWAGIGDPKDVERIVRDVLAGTFSYPKEREFQAQREAEAKARSEADINAARAGGASQDQRYPGYREAMARGDATAALASLNAAFKADPASETSGAYQWKFMLLMQRNKPAEVNEYARSLLERYPDNDDIMSFSSACIVSTSDELRFDPELALATARRAHAMAKPDSRWAQFTKWRLGWALYHTGHRDEAKATITEALANIERLKGTIDFDDLKTECDDALRAINTPPK